MPKKLEEIKKAVMRSGRSESDAYAIATSVYNKMKKKAKKKTSKKKVKKKGGRRK